mgnify:CR=1 FL=1
MKNYVDELLLTMNTPLAYDEQALHHHIVALTFDALSGKSALPYDALSMIIYRYEGRIPQRTLGAVAEIFGLEPCEWKVLLKEVLNRSESLIAVLNRKQLGDKQAAADYSEAVKQYSEKLPNRRHHFLRYAFSQFDGSVRYDLMRYPQLLTSLKEGLEKIGQGVPGSLPQGLCTQFAVTDKISHAFTYPYLLYRRECLYQFCEDALAQKLEAAEAESEEELTMFDEAE